LFSNSSKKLCPEASQLASKLLYLKQKSGGWNIAMLYQKNRIEEDLKTSVESMLGSNFNEKHNELIRDAPEAIIV